MSREPRHLGQHLGSLSRFKQNSKRLVSVSETCVSGLILVSTQKVLCTSVDGLNNSLGRNNAQHQKFKNKQLFTVPQSSSGTTDCIDRETQHKNINIKYLIC